MAKAVSAHREPHGNPPQHGVRHRLTDWRARVLEQGGEQAGRHHEEPEACRLDQVLRPVLAQRRQRPALGSTGDEASRRGEALGRTRVALAPRVETRPSIPDVPAAPSRRSAAAAWPRAPSSRSGGSRRCRRRCRRGSTRRTRPGPASGGPSGTCATPPWTGRRPSAPAEEDAGQPARQLGRHVPEGGADARPGRALDLELGP